MILDASVLAPLVVTGGGGLVGAFRRCKPLILDLTVYEACNAFWKEAVKTRRMSVEDAVKCSKALRGLLRYVRLVKVEELELDAVEELAVEEELTFYDAAYLHLALTTREVLATEDGDLRRAAAKRGVRVLSLEEALNALGLSRP